MIARQVGEHGEAEAQRVAAVRSSACEEASITAMRPVRFDRAAQQALHVGSLRRGALRFDPCVAERYSTVPRQRDRLARVSAIAR